MSEVSHATRNTRPVGAPRFVFLIPEHKQCPRYLKAAPYYTRLYPSLKFTLPLHLSGGGQVAKYPRRLPPARRPRKAPLATGLF